MVRAKRSSRIRSRLFVERLEQRELMAMDVMAQARPLDPQPYFYMQLQYGASATGEFKTIDSENAFDAKLKELVGQHWDALFDSEMGDPPQPFSSTRLAETFTLGSTNDHAQPADPSARSSDGYLYAVVGGSVQVADLRDPANLTVDVGIALDSSESKLLVTGDSLVLLTPIHRSYSQLSGVYAAMAPQTKITVYDISQRQTPRLVSTTVVDGANTMAQLADGQLTLVQSNQNLLPVPGVIVDGAGAERFESLDSYFATNRDKILSALLPDLAQTLGSQLLQDGVDLGSWDDVAFANDFLGNSTTVARFQVNQGDLKLVDAEIIAGLSASGLFAGAQDIYLIDNGIWGKAENPSYLYKLDVRDDGQLKASGMAKVAGQVSDARWLGEHDGVLQVASRDVQTAGGSMVGPTEAQYWSPSYNYRTNLTTIGDTADGWKVLGSLTDIANGKDLYAASFIGDRALLATDAAEDSSDLLQLVDLGDPANPVAIGQLVIAGSIKSLHPVDQSHWLAIGFDHDFEVNNPRHLQVNLIEVASLTALGVMDSWVASADWRYNEDYDAATYDPATGVLSILPNVLQRSTYIPGSLLKVDLNAEDTLQHLGDVPLKDHLLQGITADDIYVAIGPVSIETFAVAQPEEPLDQVRLINLQGADDINFHLPADSTFVWTRPETVEPFAIESVETSGPIGVVANADHTVTVSMPALDNIQPQSVKLSVRFETGYTRTLDWTIYANTPYFATSGNESSNIRAADVGSQQDVNSDGLITALDVLQVVNYINARLASAQSSFASNDIESGLDISGDGIVSGLDVLQIINIINASSDAPGSAEGEHPLSLWALAPVDPIARRATLSRWALAPG